MTYKYLNTCKWFQSVKELNMLLKATFTHTLKSFMACIVSNMYLLKYAEETTNTYLILDMYFHVIRLRKTRYF